MGSVCLAVAVAACGDPTPARNHSGTPPQPVRDATPEPSQIDVAELPETGRAAGAPHAAVISQLVLASDGPAALTLDTTGGVRLWPRLLPETSPDPTQASETLVVPARHATALSLGGVDGALTVAFIDGSGAGHVVRLTGRGTWQELYATAPGAALRQLEVLPGGRELAALTGEGAVLLMTDRGRVLARYDERGFDPDQLQIAADGARLLATRREARADGAIDLVVQPLTIDRTGPAPTIAAVGDERRLEAIREPIAFSPDGAAIAYLTAAETAGLFRPALVELAGGAPALLPPEELAAVPVALGFVDRRTLLIQAAVGPSWRIDASGARAVDGPPIGAAAPTATGRDLAVVAIGRWLAVGRPSTGAQSYLGHRTFQPLTGAISASGDRLAWLMPGGAIYVTRPGGGSVTRLPPTRPAGYRLAFASDRQLVVFDSQGSIHVVDAATGEVLDRAFGGGTPRTYEVAPATATDPAVIAINPNARSPRLFELTADGTLRGPHIVPQVASAAGLLDDGGRPGLWTHDGSRLRQFTLAELRAGVTARALAERGVDRDAAQAYLGDRNGDLYHWDPGRKKLVITGSAPREIDTPETAHVYRVVPSPSGDRIAVQLSTRVIAVYDPDGDQLWSRAHANGLNDLAWSPDGRRLLVAGSSGGAIYGADDGAPIALTCGIWFERTETPPADPIHTINEPLICE